MNALSDWAVGLCAAGVACAILHMLCPDGTLRSALRVLTALLFFGCLLSPLNMLKELLADGFPKTDAATSSVSTTLSEQVDEQAVTVIESVLLSDAITRLGDADVRAVHIERTETEESGIYIERVRVVFAKEEHPLPATVKSTLENAWGVPVEVYYSDENNMDQNDLTVF